MTQEEELEELVRGGFIIGKTVGQARGEYPDIDIEIIGKRLANGVLVDYGRLIDYRTYRVSVLVDNNDVITHIYGPA